MLLLLLLLLYQPFFLSHVSCVHTKLPPTKGFCSHCPDGALLLPTYSLQLSQVSLLKEKLLFPINHISLWHHMTLLFSTYPGNRHCHNCSLLGTNFKMASRALVSPGQKACEHIRNTPQDIGRSLREVIANTMQVRIKSNVNANKTSFMSAAF